MEERPTDSASSAGASRRVSAPAPTYRLGRGRRVEAATNGRPRGSAAEPVAVTPEERLGAGFAEWCHVFGDAEGYVAACVEGGDRELQPDALERGRLGVERPIVERRSRRLPKGLHHYTQLPPVRRRRFAHRGRVRRDLVDRELVHAHAVLEQNLVDRRRLLQQRGPQALHVLRVAA